MRHNIVEIIEQRVREAREYPNEPIEHLTEDLIQKVKEWALDCVGDDEERNYDKYCGCDGECFGACIESRNVMRSIVRDAIEMGTRKDYIKCEHKYLKKKDIDAQGKPVSWYVCSTCKKELELSLIK